MNISSESSASAFCALRGHHADNDIHAELAARPRHHAVAEEHAADHQEEHDLFRPVDRCVEEIAADDIGEVQGDAGDQQHAGERRGEPTPACARPAEYDRSVIRQPAVWTRTCPPIRQSAAAGAARSPAMTDAPGGQRGYLWRAANSNSVLTALFRAGFDFDRSSPMVRDLGDHRVMLVVRQIGDRAATCSVQIFDLLRRRTPSRRDVISAVTLAPVVVDDLLQIGRQRVHPLLLITADRVDVGLVGLDARTSPRRGNCIVV